MRRALNRNLTATLSSVTMVAARKPLSSARALNVRVAVRWFVLVSVLGLLLGSPAQAQQPLMHYQHAGALPPGAIGFQQLQRGGPLPGYFQPVEIKGPPGSMISLAVENRFGEARPSPMLAGMQIGPVYRVRVTNVPNNPGLEVYPTIEVINRLYPPPGDEPKFPIPVELTKEELEMAAAGKFITRIVYLEDVDKAVQGPLDPVQQSYFEVQPGDDPLVVADGLGRPMAILRIGSRLPDSQTGPDAQFLYNSPPWLFFALSEEGRQARTAREARAGMAAATDQTRGSSR